MATRQKNLGIFTGLGIFAIAFSEPALGVVSPSKKSIKFVSEVSELRVSIPLPATATVETLEPPLPIVKSRLVKSAKDERVEPITLSVPKNDAGIKALVKEIGLPKERNKLVAYLRARVRKNNEKKSIVRVQLGRDELKLVSLPALAKKMARTHHKVILHSKDIFANAQMRKQLFEQIKPFFSVNHRKQLWRKLAKGANLSLDRELLPGFAGKMVRKFLMYRGPNCFHAALSFQGQRLTSSPLVNVKEEKGYHEAMINYDELWRAINQHFYEVDPKESPLKYGDMLVFFSVPQGPVNDINFRWIRHASTYLFGPYTFSKGSKSPDTPYSVKTLQEEWDTWRAFTSNMGVKVYRRNFRKPVKAPPVELTDWIY